MTGWLCRCWNQELFSIYCWVNYLFLSWCTFVTLKEKWWVFIFTKFVTCKLWFACEIFFLPVNFNSFHQSKQIAYSPSSSNLQSSVWVSEHCRAAWLFEDGNLLCGWPPLEDEHDRCQMARVKRSKIASPYSCGIQQPIWPGHRNPLMSIPTHTFGWTW